MSATEDGRPGSRGIGPLTGITAVRVEVRVQQYEVEPCNWATHLQDPDPAVVAMTGTLGDFDGDPTTGQGKTVYALRLRDPDATVQQQIRTQVEDALRGNFIAVSRTASATFRLTAQTFHEAGRPDRFVLVRIECLQMVRLASAPSREVPAVIWARDDVSWDIAERCWWPGMYVCGAIDAFLRIFHRQQPGTWFREMAEAFPGGLPPSSDDDLSQEEEGVSP